MNQQQIQNKRFGMQAEENGWMDLAYKEEQLYLTFNAGITDRLEVHLANTIIKRKPRGPKTVQNSHRSVKTLAGLLESLTDGLRKWER